MNKFLFSKELKYRLWRHVTFFLSLVLVFTLILFARNQGRDFLHFFTVTFINALIFLGYGYLTIFVLIPVFLPKKKYWWLAILFVTLGLLLSVVKLAVSDFIFYSSISPEFGGSSGMLNLRFVLINTKDMSFIVGLFVVARFTRDWLLIENQYHILKNSVDELNFKLLQSHFEPHFLFNTLNNLYALSLKNPVKTLEVIRRFKSLLRFSVEGSQKSFVKVSEEMTMIGNYIAIEQIRYGSRLKVTTSTIGSCGDLLIPPFLLFPLVENCFRHGSSTDAGSPWIRLELTCEKNRLLFETKNSRPKCLESENAAQEKGLSKLRQRMEVIYPKKFLLETHEEPLAFSAKLEIHATELNWRK